VGGAYSDDATDDALAHEQENVLGKGGLWVRHCCDFDQGVALGYGLGGGDGRSQRGAVGLRVGREVVHDALPLERLGLEKVVDVTEGEKNIFNNAVFFFSSLFLRYQKIIGYSCWRYMSSSKPSRR